jgi:hypothetical protein
MTRRLMSWFGRAWSWPSLRQKDHVGAPVGQTCEHCGRPILVDDQGVVVEDGGLRGPVHRDCFYGFVFGRKAA